jgi:hypothetical protein
MSLILDGTNGVSDIDGTAATPAIRGTDANTGIFFPAADTIAFSEGGTESMRINSSGQVGIGTSSPATILNAYNATSAIISVDGEGTTQFRASKYSTDVAPSQVNLRKARGTLASPTAVATSDVVGTNQYQAYDGTQFRIISTTQGIVENYTGTDNIAGALVFQTRPTGAASVVTERMRIDSSGNLLINTTSLNSGKVNIVASGASQPCMVLNDSDATSGSQGILSIRRNGTAVGLISTTNTNTTYATSSDYRLKEDIVPMTGALSTVSALKPVTYKWKSTGEESQGFIAHELQAVVPDCVTGEKDAVDTDGKPVYQGIDTSFLVATLTAAIQELKAELDIVKAELVTLKGAA